MNKLRQTTIMKKYLIALIIVIASCFVGTALTFAGEQFNAEAFKNAIHENTDQAVQDAATNTDVSLEIILASIKEEFEITAEDSAAFTEIFNKARAPKVETAAELSPTVTPPTSVSTTARPADVPRYSDAGEVITISVRNEDGSSRSIESRVTPAGEVASYLEVLWMRRGDVEIASYPTNDPQGENGTIHPIPFGQKVEIGVGYKEVRITDPSVLFPIHVIQLASQVNDGNMGEMRENDPRMQCYREVIRAQARINEIGGYVGREKL